MPRSSTTSRSASPLAWATQTPPHARMMGSIAVTTPLAGVSGTIVRPRRTWLTGSRFETTTSGPIAEAGSRELGEPLLGPHRLAPEPEARLLGDRHPRPGRLRARSLTSEARGPNSAGSSKGGGGPAWPARSWRAHSAIRFKGCVTLRRTTRSVTRLSTATSTAKRIRCCCASSHRARSMWLASERMTSTPRGRLSLRSGTA